MLLCKWQLLDDHNIYKGDALITFCEQEVHTDFSFGIAMVAHCYLIMKSFSLFIHISVSLFSFIYLFI